MGIYYKDVVTEITDEGKRNIVKQDNGTKYSIIGAILFSDYNNYVFSLYSKKESEEFEKTELHKLDWNTLSKNTTIIFKDISYKNINQLYIYDNEEYLNALYYPKNHILPIQISYSNKNEEKQYISYDFILKTNLLQITKTSDSIDNSFDGLGLLAYPYKPDELDYEHPDIDPNKLVLFSVSYFPNNKIYLLKNQNNYLAMNIELHFSFDEIYETDLNFITNDTDTQEYLDNDNLFGLHVVNDGLNSKNNDDRMTLGGTNKLFISNVDAEAYDSFSKLNIMSTVASSYNESVPQLMFTIANKGSKKSWNGDRLSFLYTSGINAASFKISEVTGNYRNKLNFELIGSNNIYHTSVSGTHNNTFIFSENNILSNNNANNNFIHSDENSIYNPNTSGITFINSNDNSIISGNYDEITTSATNISLYNSNNNIFNPSFEFVYSYDDSDKTSGLNPVYNSNNDIIGYTFYQKIDAYNNYYLKGINGGNLQNNTLIQSNYNRFYGSNYDNRTTIINSNSGHYKNYTYSKNVISIGNDYAFIKGNSGNTIAIGRGLINNESSDDKIILGYFNKNSIDPNEILIVGDGKLNETYLNSITSAISDNNNKVNEVLRNISGDGSVDNDSGFYRHNIFTVNKNGYITISDWKIPNNSARYGYKGITAYIDNETYELPFKTLYNTVNTNNSILMMQETLDYYELQIKNLIENIPSNYNFIPKSNTKILYINSKNTKNINNAEYAWSALSANINHNTLLNVTNQNSSDITYESILTKNGTSSTYSGTISPYCSKQFLYLNISSTNNDEASFEGFSPVND